MATRTTSGTASPAPPRQHETLTRVRVFLDEQFARFGYARVPDPREHEEERVLLLKEFHRQLVQSESILRGANTRAKLARALSQLLARAKAKVAYDQVWSETYADERTEEHAEMVRAAGRSTPADWRDL